MREVEQKLIIYEVRISRYALEINRNKGKIAPNINKDLINNHIKTSHMTYKNNRAQSYKSTRGYQDFQMEIAQPTTPELEKPKLRGSG